MLYPFQSWPEEDQNHFIEHLERLRANVERIKFNDLVEAPDEEKRAVIEEFHERRRYLIGMIYEFEEGRDE